jgi:hypothetical protein
MLDQCSDKETSNKDPTKSRVEGVLGWRHLSAEQRGKQFGRDCWVVEAQLLADGFCFAAIRSPNMPTLVQDACCS